jgi:hypothetical protein
MERTSIWDEMRCPERKEMKKGFPLEGPKGVQKGPSGPGNSTKGGLVDQRNKKERKESPTPPYLFVCALFSCEQIELISGLGSWFANSDFELLIFQNCNFWTVHYRRSQLVPFSLHFPGDCIFHSFLKIHSQETSYDPNKAVGVWMKLMALVDHIFIIMILQRKNNFKNMAEIGGTTKLNLDCGRRKIFFRRIFSRDVLSSAQHWQP